MPQPGLQIANAHGFSPGPGRGEPPRGVYFDGTTLVIEAPGNSEATASLRVVRLDPATNAPTTLFTLDKNGSLIFGGTSPWADVRHFGAVGDGATDDSAAIQAAIDAVEALGGGTVYFPFGNYLILTGLTVNKPVLLAGAGRGDSAIVAASLASTRITYNGAVDGSAMIRFVHGTASTILYGGGVRDMLLEGSARAGTAVRLSSTNNVHLDNLTIRRCTGRGVRLDDENGASCGFNVLGDIKYVYGVVGAGTENSHGVELIAVQEVGVTQNIIREITGLLRNGAMVRFSGCDNNFVGRLHSSIDGAGTGYGAYFANHATGTMDSNYNLIYYCVGDVHAESGTEGNRILHLLSEGAGVTIDSGGHLDYVAQDYVTSEVYQTHRFAMSDELFIPAGAFLNDPATSAAVGVSASQWPVWELVNAAFSKVGVVLPPPYSWDNGTIDTIRLHFVGDTASATVVRVHVLAGTFASGASVATPEYDNTADITMNAAANRDQSADYAAALAYTKGDRIYLSIERDGAHANDTYAGVMELVGVSLLYTGTGPNSGGSGTFDVSAPYTG